MISRLLPATAITPRLLNPLMCGPPSTRCTASISTPAISSASSTAFLIDSTAASRLVDRRRGGCRSTRPRRCRRCRGRPPRAARRRWRRPSRCRRRGRPRIVPSVPRMLLTLPDGGARGYRHPVPPRDSRPHVHAAVDTQVHRVDVRHPRVQRLGPAPDTSAGAPVNCSLADVHERASPTRASARRRLGSFTSICETRCIQPASRRERGNHRVPPARTAVGPIGWPAFCGVRPSTIGRSSCA